MRSEVARSKGTGTPFAAVSVWTRIGIGADWRLGGVIEEAGVSSPSWQNVYSCYMVKP